MVVVVYKSVSVVIFIQICLWLLLLVSTLPCATSSAVHCLATVESQLKDSNKHLTGLILEGSRVDRWSDHRVTSIDLDGLGLHGEFPSGVKECSALTSLHLSGNNFSGALPWDLFNFLPYLVTLDLSNNSFSGKIPATWSNVAYLNLLWLDHNQLTGSIPLGLASCPRLKQFSVAHNHLTGPIPEFTEGEFSRASFEDNLDLCGFPLDPCPSEPFFLMTMNAAAIVAAIFFPVGAAIGWWRGTKAEAKKTVKATAWNRSRNV